jgi:hypothetical protein
LLLVLLGKSIVFAVLAIVASMRVRATSDERAPPETTRISSGIDKRPSRNSTCTIVVIVLHEVTVSTAVIHLGPASDAQELLVLHDEMRQATNW